MICKWTDDSQRLILEHFDIIANSPSEIYHYALPFSPSKSWLRKCYSLELLKEVKVVKGHKVEWGACSRIVHFDHGPTALACWKDIIAVGSLFGDIIILDAITGTYTSVLSGHTSRVGSLVFSFGGNFLVSGSDDKTVNFWDIQTGGVIKTFLGHTGWVLSVSISQDQTTIASGCWDETVRLWNIETGECCHVIKQQAGVCCVSFSPTDTQCLMSVSDDKIWQWDREGHQTGPVYDGSCYVAFSLDGTQFVSCNGAAVTVQSSDSRVIMAEFHVANSDFKCCCFSSDGRLVAGAAGSTIYVWDIAGSKPHLIETFVGHTSKITSLAFSSSLISTSEDKSVKFWQIGTLSPGPVVIDTVSTPITSASIESVTLQPRDGIAISSDSAGVVKIWDISTGLCKVSFQTPAEGHTLRDAQLLEGRLILIWHVGQKVHIWDAEKGDSRMLDVPEFGVNGIRISGDGSKVFIAMENFIQAWSVQTGEAVGEVELKGDPFLDSLYVDGSKIWVCFKDSPIQGWDFGTPSSSPVPLSNTSSGRPCLDFIDGTGWWHTSPARVNDTVMGKIVFQLHGKYTKPTVVHWDGQYLVAGYTLGNVLILDFNHLLPQ